MAPNSVLQTKACAAAAMSPYEFNEDDKNACLGFLVYLFCGWNVPSSYISDGVARATHLIRQKFWEFKTGLPTMSGAKNRMRFTSAIFLA